MLKYSCIQRALRHPGSFPIHLKVLLSRNKIRYRIQMILSAHCFGPVYITTKKGLSLYMPDSLSVSFSANKNERFSLKIVCAAA